jgi:EpsI family protein
MRLSIHSVTAMLVLVSVMLFLRHAPQAEDVPLRLGLAAFPFEWISAEHGATHWIGRDVGLEPDILAVLRVDDYMMRVYAPLTPDLSRLTAPVWLYVGYYQTQRSGVTYHSPLNCLPGSGWNILSREVTPLAIGDRGPAASGELRVNKVVIQKGLETQLVLYWYQDRGRTITSEYWAKAYLLLDAITRNRTDGALVRISVPIAAPPGDRRGVDEAFGVASQLLRDAYPRLLAHLPA